MGDGIMALFGAPLAHEDHAVRAFALAEELEMRPLVSHYHLGLGQLYRRIANREQAREHLATAAKLY